MATKKISRAYVSGKRKATSRTKPNRTEAVAPNPKPAEDIGAASKEAGTDTTPVKATPAQLEFLRMICSANPNTAAEVSGEKIDPDDTAFLFAASQVNIDLALAAVYEADGTLSPDDIDSNFFDMLRSPSFATLRESFIEDATKVNRYALLHFGWRCHNAGRLSPDRLKCPPQGSTKNV